METRKVRLFGGKWEGLTIQAPVIGGDIIVVGGVLYVYLEKMDSNGFFCYEVAREV